MIEPRRFLPLLAGTGALIILHQTFELFSALAGVDPATPSGRVRLLTMLWFRSSPFALADIFLIAAAIGLQRSRALTSLARIHLAVGALCLVAVPVLLVSAGQVAPPVGGGGMGMFRVATARALIGLTLAGGTAILAARALRGSQPLPPARAA